MNEVNRGVVVASAVAVMLVALAAGWAVAQSQGVSARTILNPDAAMIPPAATTTGAAPATSSRPTSRAFDKQLRGLSLQMHLSAEDHPYEQIVGDIAKTGANCVKLVVTGYQDHGGSVEVKVEPNRAPSDTKLKATIAAAHKDKLTVVLMPIVLLASPREGEWRGKLDPKADDGGWDKWWESYTKFILRYAKVAQDAKVEMLMVGSELISTERQTERWEALIAEVRKVYGGKLSYSANWDHYRPVKFWDKLDVVGMTSYYDLVGDDKPTREKLLQSWAKIRDEILEWQQTINRPIVFTEVGWPNQVTAAKYPWDYYRSSDKPDPQLQKLCFETFFETFGQLPWVSGTLVWEWCTSPTQDTSPEKDTGYCPKDKPAMKVILEFFKTGKVTSTPAK